MSGFTLSSSGMCEIDQSSLCDNNCAYCGFGTEFSLDNTTCISCIVEFCSVCKDGECFACYPGYYLDNATCMSCSEECKTCFDNETCDLCASGFFKQVVDMGEGISSAIFADECLPCH